jgi:hypothetical protein
MILVRMEVYVYLILRRILPVNVHLILLVYTANLCYVLMDFVKMVETVP